MGNALSYNFKAIGKITNNIHDVSSMPVVGVESKIVINEDLKDGLIGLNDYSHLIVLAYLHKVPKKFANQLIKFPSGDTALPEQGVFALRGWRPNLISFNVGKIKKIVDSVIEVEDLDLISGTPVLDLKPYLPYYDSLNDAKIPKWAK